MLKKNLFLPTRTYLWNIWRQFSQIAESFGLFQKIDNILWYLTNLMKFNEISQHLTKFWCKKLCFSPILLLITFAFDDFESLLQNFSFIFRLFQILEISNLTMAKDEKVSIKVTYIKQARDNFSLFWREISYREKGS